MLQTVLYVVLGLAALAALVLAYAARRPDTFRIARSTRIAAPPEAIFPLISDLRKLALWNPYETKDPDMQRAYSGAESGPGQRYDWDGNRNIGKGALLVREASAPSRVAIDLIMVAPMAARNRLEFTLRPEGGATDVTWAMEGRSPLVAKVLHFVCDMDRMVGTDFEAGLARLKALAEGARVPSVQS